MAIETSASPDAYVRRVEGLRSKFESRKISLLVVSNPRNIYYLTGFRGSAGIAAFDLSQGALWVDPRYTLQARDAAKGVEVIEAKISLLKAVGQWLRKKKHRRVGYEDSHLTCAEFRLLEREATSRVRLFPAGGLVEELRLVKDHNEIAHLRAAGRITSEAFEEVLRQVRPGVKESDLAAELEYRMRQRGAEAPAFETIVASGPRAAFPHARATAKLLQLKDLVIIDLGAILAGYAADMTRTIHLGEPSRQVRRYYNAVIEAQGKVVETLRPGVRAGTVDKAARKVLARYGLARYFTHSTGHGVGLEIHERPRLGKGEKISLAAGCVVTAEPGIYLEGFGGIRIEDTVLVGPEGPEILTPASKSSWFLK